MKVYCICGCDCAGNSLLCDRLGKPCIYCGCGSNVGPIQHKEENEMLPSPKNEQESTGQRGGRGKREYSVNYIKVENLTADPQTAKILGVRTENIGYNDIQIKINIRGTSYFLGMKVNYKIYKTLFNELGADETKWVGKEIKMFAEWDDYDEKNRIALTVPEQKTTTRK